MEPGTLTLKEIVVSHKATRQVLGDFYTFQCTQTYEPVGFDELVYKVRHDADGNEFDTTVHPLYDELFQRVVDEVENQFDKLYDDLGLPGKEI